MAERSPPGDKARRAAARRTRQLYYVGANDIAAFLITGPEGHAVLDGGYPTTALMIMASIARLGFDIKDVKVLLNSEPHRTPTTRAGWRRSNRRAAPSCGPATRARTPSPPAATTPTWYRGGISWVLSTYTNRLDMTAH